MKRYILTRYVLLIVTIAAPCCCLGQFRVSLSTGLAGFNMKEMKQHQAELRVQFPTQAKVIESFPSFWFYELYLTGQISKRVTIGGSIGFTSTGGRMDYRDYSGSIECNQTTQAWTPATRCEVLLNPDKKWLVYFTGKAGAYFGHYELRVLAEVNNDRNDNTVEFNSINAFVEPGFLLSKNIVGSLNAMVTAGYNLNVFQGKQKLSSDSSLFLQNNSGGPVNLDWSGFRLGFGMSVDF